VRNFASRVPRLRVRNGLLVHLVALLTLLVAVTALAVGSVATQVIGRQIEQSADRRLRDGVAFFQAALDERRDDVQAAGRWLAQDPQFVGAVQRRDLPALEAPMSSAVRLRAVHDVIVADPQGTILARQKVDRVRGVATQVRNPAYLQAAGGQDVSGMSQATDGSLRLQTYHPVWAAGQPSPIAVVRVAFVVDDQYLESFQSRSGLDASIFFGNARVLTTLQRTDGSPLTEAEADPAMYEAVVVRGEPVFTWRDLPSGRIRSYSAPLMSPDGTRVGMISIAMPTAQIQSELWANLLSVAPTVGWIVLAGVAIAYLLARRVRDPVLQLAAAASRLSAGDLATPIPKVRATELAPLAEELEHARSSLQASVQAMANEETRQRALLGALSEPIITTTLDGRITGFNPAARLLFGMPTRMAGRSIRDVLLFLGRPGAQGYDEQSWQWRFTDPGGRALDLEISRTRLQGSNLPVTDVYVVHDVSHHVELNRLREQLLYNVAHELRAPMAVLENAVDIIATDYGELSSAEFDQLTGSMGRTVRRLRLLMEDLLSAGSIQSGKFQINPGDVELEPILEEAVSAMSLQLELRRQRVNTQVPDDCAQVFADRRYVRQVLTNLLSNAGKYSADDETIEVRAERVNGHVKLAVEDHGPGIPPEQQAGLFERFYRVRPGNREPGIGLGLAIAKGIVDAHGGTMGVESAVGRGTTVWFTLPHTAPDDDPGADE
jgi:signal transduction histidine kinase/HAMP domain-containing protein